MCKPLAVFHGFHSRSEGEKGEKYICLNLINFRKSMRYNPLAYIRSEKDTLSLFLSFVNGGSTLTKKARWEANAAV